MVDYETIKVDNRNGSVATITLNRPDKRNAQNLAMIYELNDALDVATEDDGVKVIVLNAEGPHFSAGHDLRETASIEEFQPVSTWRGFGLPGAEGAMALEHEVYFGMCWRWRNIPKPLIAATHGRAIAGGLMFLWVCDIIVASDNAVFVDPTVAAGVNGVEYHAHTWELGARKAKELLFTGGELSADEAYRLGMVNHVVPHDELVSFTLDLAARVAAMPSFGLKLAKESVNQTLDAQGQWSALRAAFSLQTLAHSHNRELYGQGSIPGALGPRRSSVEEEGSSGAAEGE